MSMLANFEELQEAIRASRQPGEKILWQGLPQPRPISLSFMIRLSIILVGFSILIAYLFGDPPFLLEIVGAGSAWAYFSVISVYFSTLPAPPIFYLITDRRALVIAAGRAPQIFEPTQMVFRQKRKNDDGSYDLYFFSNRDARNRCEGHTAAKPPGFHYLRRVRSAEKALLALMRRKGLLAEPAVTVSPDESPSWLSRKTVICTANGIAAGLAQLFRRPILLCIVTTIVFIIIHAIKAVLFH
jgi:hypothetical protein